MLNRHQERRCSEPSPASGYASGHASRETQGYEGTSSPRLQPEALSPNFGSKEHSNSLAAGDSTAQDSSLGFISDTLRREYYAARAHNSRANARPHQARLALRKLSLDRLPKNTSLREEGDSSRLGSVCESSDTTLTWAAPNALSLEQEEDEFSESDCASAQGAFESSFQGGNGTLPCINFDTISEIPEVPDHLADEDGLQYDDGEETLHAPGSLTQQQQEQPQEEEPQQRQWPCNLYRWDAHSRFGDAHAAPATNPLAPAEQDARSTYSPSINKASNRSRGSSSSNGSSYRTSNSHRTSSSSCRSSCSRYTVEPEETSTLGRNSDRGRSSPGGSPSGSSRREECVRPAAPEPHISTPNSSFWDLSTAGSAYAADFEQNAALQEPYAQGAAAQAIAQALAQANARAAAQASTKAGAQASTQAGAQEGTQAGTQARTQAGAQASTCGATPYAPRYAVEERSTYPANVSPPLQSVPTCQPSVFRPMSEPHEESVFAPSTVLKRSLLAAPAAGTPPIAGAPTNGQDELRRTARQGVYTPPPDPVEAAYEAGQPHGSGLRERDSEALERMQRILQMEEAHAEFARECREQIYRELGRQSPPSEHGRQSPPREYRQASYGFDERADYLARKSGHSSSGGSSSSSNMRFRRRAQRAHRCATDLSRFLVRYPDIENCDPDVVQNLREVFLKLGNALDSKQIQASAERKAARHSWHHARAR